MLYHSKTCISDDVLNNFESHNRIWFVAVRTSRALVFASLHTDANADVSLKWTVALDHKDL